MSDINQIMNNIKEEITSPEPSSNRIITHLSDLRTKEEYQSLSDSEFYDIVGETFKLNPEFFMKNIYGEMLLLQTRGRKLYKKVNKKEMEKYIIEKFCLYEGEQILYECNGVIKQWSGKVKLIVNDGNFFITNYRIIAHGKLSASGGRTDLLSGNLVLDLAISAFSGGSKRAKSKTGIIDASTHQELPCYGYQFPLKDHFKLKKKKDGITYILPIIVMDKVEKIWFTRITLAHPNMEQINNLFEAFWKKQSVNQIVDKFRNIQKIKKKKSIVFLDSLRLLWKWEEYQHLSDSDYLYIIKEAYKLDPELFMTSIYPRMMSWKFPSFLSIKKEIIELIEILSA